MRDVHVHLIRAYSGRNLFTSMLHRAGSGLGVRWY